ncbi:MAG: putative integral rane protein [Chloroflexota bacterium]|nr:putative integral rane protein [Chloroflexota bacterium]
MNLFPLLLFAHVLGAIIAFGPAFSFPIIGAMAGKEPMHANFATRVADRLAHVQLTPLALLQGITGLGLIYFGNIDLFKSTWLLIAIVLYVIALGYAGAVQSKAVAKVIELSGGTPTPGAVPSGPPAGGPPAGGPPPELLAAIKKVQQGGLFLVVLIVLIVFLMVTKLSF